MIPSSIGIAQHNPPPRSLLPREQQRPPEVFDSALMSAHTNSSGTGMVLPATVSRGCQIFVSSDQVQWAQSECVPILQHLGLSCYVVEVLYDAIKDFCVHLGIHTVPALVFAQQTFSSTNKVKDHLVQGQQRILQTLHQMLALKQQLQIQQQQRITPPASVPRVVGIVTDQPMTTFPDQQQQNNGSEQGEGPHKSKIKSPADIIQEQLQHQQHNPNPKHTSNVISANVILQEQLKQPPPLPQQNGGGDQANTPQRRTVDSNQKEIPPEFYERKGSVDHLAADAAAAAAAAAGAPSTNKPAHNAQEVIGPDWQHSMATFGQNSKALRKTEQELALFNARFAVP